MWSCSRTAALASLALVAAITLAACDSDGSAPPLDSGIEGLVTIGPACPVVREGTPCPDEPFQASIVIEDDVGDEVARAMAGEDGRFQVNLPPGTYRLVPEEPSPGAPPHAEERQVIVREGAFTQVAVEYDSGIR